MATDTATERTYRAIGRFIFEFSQVEYCIRVYLAEQIGLADEYFTAVVGSYDVALLVAVTKQVFNKEIPRDLPEFMKSPPPAYLQARQQPKPPRKARKDRGKQIEDLLNRFMKLNECRTRVAHGLWVPFTKGGTVHHISRNKLSSAQFESQAAELEEYADELRRLRANLEEAFTALDV
jgi:hypothetical protein